MFDTFQGLPVHGLVVHATVVLLPLAAVLVILAAVVPRFRVWAGPLPAAAAVVSLILVPVSTASGDELYARLKATVDQFGGTMDPLIEEHKDLAELLIFLVVPFAVLAVAAYVLHRREASPRVLLAVSVLAVLAATAVLIDVALIGHAGSKAVWQPVIEGTTP